MKQEFYSNGKLLLSGEYAVLEGAEALAIPTSYGQQLSVESNHENRLVWNSLDHNDQPWFTTEISPEELVGEHVSTDPIKSQLLQLLNIAKKSNPNFLQTFNLRITTQLSFPRNWGLGSSSTLINNIAQWAQVDAFQLLDEGFGGSGYDIAAAKSNRPIIFRKEKEKHQYQEIDLSWSFKDQLFFVFLNRKQSSREAIAHFRRKLTSKKVDLDHISELTQQFVNCDRLEHFNQLCETHETLMASILELPSIKESFPDYEGGLKSLGAWGGDFILATGSEEGMSYFREKGYTTIIPFTKMIKK